MLKIAFYLALLPLFLTVVYGQTQSFYCAHNATYVRLGDSQNHVKQACGQPNQISQRALPHPGHVQKSEMWIYTANQLNLNFRSIHKRSTDPILTFTINNEKIANITYNNVSTQSINLCKGRLFVRTGDLQTKVREQCGNPSQIKTLATKQPATENPKQNKVIWTYSDDYGSNTTLIFQHNKLISIE